ncbi:hypothetical protein WCN79_20205 [Xanthomonas axonopodis pv. vasculorum]|uniref:hypothetical protein n=1 Tax=Xanthomonas axonopodis TaxID=53413 RepID=UPI001FD2822A|nr:hypothetical protein [Xanthomonas axonopodis]
MMTSPNKTSRPYCIPIFIAIFTAFPSYAEEAIKEATPADTARVFELAEQISSQLEKTPSQFIQSWPGTKISNLITLDGIKASSISGGKIKIGDHINAKDSLIKTSPGAGKITSVLLSLEGSCISRKDFKNRYPAYLISNIPRGQSNSEMLTLAVIRKDKKMEFSFPQSTPQCLSAINIAPADSQILKAAGEVK